MGRGFDFAFAGEGLNWCFRFFIWVFGSVFFLFLCYVIYGCVGGGGVLSVILEFAFCWCDVSFLCLVKCLYWYCSAGHFFCVG